jgi:phosphoglycolate phosphatase
VEKLLVFDLDGTLIDSRSDLAAAVNTVRAEQGLDLLTVKQVKSFIGNGISKLIERSFADATVDLSVVLERYRTVYYSQSTVHTILYPGVKAGLEQLQKAGMVSTVLTNKPGEISRSILEALGLLSFFKTVIGAEDGYALKPSSEGLRALMKAHKVDADSCWMIGDHHTDLVAGMDADVRTAFVSYGFGHTDDLKPTKHFASFSEVVEYFLQS